MIDTKTGQSRPFVVLCGMPRCGTRQFADFLNRHHDVCIQGEIRHALLRPLRDMMAAGDAAYPQGYASNYFQRKRAQAVVELFASFSKARRVMKPKATFHGFKTPQIESHHKRIDQIVGTSFATTAYLYCIRNVADCYLSLVEMPWFTDGPNAYIDKYIESLETAIELRHASLRTGARASIGVLNLDDFIACDDKPTWLARRLFHPLTIPASDEWIKEIAETTDNRNATERATGTRRAKVLGGAAAEVFALRLAEVERAVERFNRTFSENLSCRLPLAAIAA
ncbi:hypothetical protein [Novosphingobium percolationis]|uniref:hypothetical protein n=1 Tax=Novosphingobium percolationis TaxID=2871811 RepID=UPI001CD6AD11|nr:hypothetical protein [Novosphingobium percolationis]MCH7628500.1 hypothetical protein [Pseudomonadota bacterium]